MSHTYLCVTYVYYQHHVRQSGSFYSCVCHDSSACHKSCHTHMFCVFYSCHTLFLMGTAALYRVFYVKLWRRLRVHRAFIYSDWFGCSVCFCSLLPRLTLLLSFFEHSALPPPRGGSASRVSPQSCQSHESLWGSCFVCFTHVTHICLVRDMTYFLCVLLCRRHSMTQDIWCWYAVATTSRLL